MRVPLSHTVPARSVSRILVHALAAAVLAATALLVLDGIFPLMAASALFTILAPGISALVAANYFWRRGAEEPLIVAIAFTTVAGLVDLALVNLVGGGFPLMHPAFGFGFSLLLSFGATGLTGELLPRFPGLHSV